MLRTYGLERAYRLTQRYPNASKATSRDGNPKRPQEVFAFGEFAPDGRIQSVRFALDPGYGAA
ncbi:hypothetical protein U5640_09855 [Streptomyces sp. SS7]|uniref:hypothetical protein n=1 Tax=Streptomyces sp. SS7 TaxID=3108485 RepID=UPI0030EE4CC9